MRREEGDRIPYFILLKMTYFWKTPIESFTWGQFGIYLTDLQFRSSVTQPTLLDESTQKSISSAYQFTLLLSGKRETNHVLSRTNPPWVPNLYTERYWGTNWSPNVTSKKHRHTSPGWMPHSGSQDDGWHRVPAGCAHSHCFPLSKSQESRK